MRKLDLDGHVMAAANDAGTEVCSVCGYTRFPEDPKTGRSAYRRHEKFAAARFDTLVKKVAKDLAFLNRREMVG